MQTTSKHCGSGILLLGTVIGLQLSACAKRETTVNELQGQDASPGSGGTSNDGGHPATTSAARPLTHDHSESTGEDSEPQSTGRERDGGGWHSSHHADAQATAAPPSTLNELPDGGLGNTSPGNTSLGNTSTVSLDATSPTQDDATSIPTLPDAGGVQRSARLVVADPEAWSLYVYDVPSLELVGTYEGVHFSEHGGFLPLGDGRVMFLDDQNYTLNIHDVFGAVPGDLTLMAPLASAPVHFAIDGEQRFAAVSGMGASGGADLFTLVDLATSDVAYASIPTGEPGVLLGGSPLHLYHRNDDPPAMEAYDFDALWSGVVAPLASVPLGTEPHGEAIAHAAGKLFSAADEGLYVMDAAGGDLSVPRIVPYAADGRVGGRAFYGRLGADGNYLYSYLRNDGDAHDRAWRDWQNDAFIVNVHDETTKRVELGNGLVYRLATSSRFAVFAQYHPDGDFALFLDTDPSSPTHHDIVGRVALSAMGATPTGPDATPWDTPAFRLTGMVPSGEYAFVTHGGDGAISVIHTGSMTIVGTISTPSPLNYGGYVVGMEVGASGADTSGR